MAWLSFLSSLNETRQASDGGVSNAAAGTEANHLLEDIGGLVDVFGKAHSKLIDKDDQHLNGGVLVLDLIRLEVDLLLVFLFAVAGPQLSQDIIDVSLFISSSYFWLQKGHVEDAWHDLVQVRSEFGLHNSADSLPSSEEVAPLRIGVFHRRLLNSHHCLDYIVSRLHEDMLADHRGDETDGLDDLGTVLSILGLHMRVQSLKHHLHRFHEVRVELLLYLNHNCGKGGN